MKNCFVGNLSWGIRDEELRELFEQYGEVKSAKVMTDRETGKSRGFGFVEMTEDESADEAIKALNGLTHEGRVLNVDVARPKTDKREYAGKR